MNRILILAGGSIIKTNKITSETKSELHLSYQSRWENGGMSSINYKRWCSDMHSCP